MCNPVNQTFCNYLFGKEAEEIFTNIEINNVEDKRKFIDQCLDVCMRAHEHVLTNKEGLFLTDPRAFNNQCHLYSLRGVQMMKLDKLKESRFSLLSFFLSMSFMGSTTQFKNVVATALKELNEGYSKQYSKEKNFYAAFKDKSIPFDRKNIQKFLQDDGNCRTNAARLSLNQDFENYMKEELEHKKDQDPLHAELYRLANENLRVKSPISKSNDLFYTFPKLAGVALMLDAMAKEKIGFAVKVKVITKDGFAGTLQESSGTFEDLEPIIIFDGIATDGSRTVKECREEAKSCPTYFQRDPAETKKHNESCFFCKKTEQDLKPYEQRLKEVMKNPQEMFSAMGADFIENTQKEFKPFFEDKENYPVLSEIFSDALPNVEKLGFSMCHAHPDFGKHAQTLSMELDTAPEQFLKERGLV